MLALLPVIAPDDGVEPALAEALADQLRSSGRCAGRILEVDVVLAALVRARAARGDVLLVKASRGMKLERLVEALRDLRPDALVVAEGQRGFRVAPMALADLADLTRPRGTFIVAFAGALLVALAWLLQKQPVTAPIIGATKISHLDDAVGALHRGARRADIDTGCVLTLATDGHIDIIREISE